MEKVTVLKRKAHLRWLEAPSAKNFQDLKCSKAEAQRAARSASKYWQELSCSIEKANNNDYIRRMYEVIKQASGPTIKRTVPLKEKIVLR